MCLAIPARVISLTAAADPIARSGTVDLQGSRLDVNLALVPDVDVGDWVLVHAGFAIESLDEDAARETWRWLREAELVEGGLPIEQPTELPPGEAAEDAT